MVVLNFAHPFAEHHLRQIERLAGRAVGTVVEIDSQADLQRPLQSQVEEMAARTGLSREDWEARPVLVNLPSLNHIAAVLLAHLHGRMGYFPTIVRVRPVAGRTPQEFEVAELIDLQATRDGARRTRTCADQCRKA
jgi:hypothetical protein